MGDGPQPEDQIIGVVCEAFNCAPDVALKQDARLVFSILDGRLAQSAKAQHNTNASKMSAGQLKIQYEMVETARAMGIKVD